MSNDNETESGDSPSNLSVFQENQKQLILQSEENFYKKNYAGMLCKICDEIFNLN